MTSLLSCSVHTAQSDVQAYLAFRLAHVQSDYMYCTCTFCCNAKPIQQSLNRFNYLATYVLMTQLRQQGHDGHYSKPVVRSLGDSELPCGPTFLWYYTFAFLWSRATDVLKLYLLKIF